MRDHLLYNQGRLTDEIKTAHGPLSLSLELRSEFPKTGSVSVLVTPDKTAEFRLALRVPAWTPRFQAWVDGRTYSVPFADAGQQGQTHAYRTWIKAR